MPKISRLNQQISAAIFENSGTTLSFWVLWFEFKLIATGCSGWTVAKCHDVKMESALFKVF